MNAYWDIRQLSSYLNVKPATLYAWTAQGKIPYVRLHGLLRFRREDIDRWIESCQLTPKTGTARLTLNKAPSTDLDSLIARAKAQAYNPRPRGNQTEIKPHRKGGT